MSDINRKYKLSFSCAASILPLVMEGLISEGLTPSINPSEEGKFKVVATLWQETLPKVMGFLCKDADQITLAPDQVLCAEARALQPKHGGPKLIYDESQVQRIPPQVLPRKSSGKLVADSPSGHVMLSVFEGRQGLIKHAPDFDDALVKAGFAQHSCGSVLSRMVNEGSIVRISRGAYRLPTDLEKIEFRKKAAGVK